MNVTYKNLAIAALAGGSIFLAMTIYDRYLRSRPHKLNKQKLIEELKELGPVQLDKDGIIDKKQMAFIIGLAQKYQPTYAQGEKKKLMRSRQAYLSTRNYKCYLDTVIESLNFEYQCTQEICEEICTILKISDDNFAESQDFYSTHKDAEYTGLVKSYAQEGTAKEISLLEANQLWGEIEDLTREANNDPAMLITSDIRMKLKDPDTVQMQREIVEMRVYDQIYEKYKWSKEEVKASLKKFEGSGASKISRQL